MHKTLEVELYSKYKKMLIMINGDNMKRGKALMLKIVNCLEIVVKSSRWLLIQMQIALMNFLSTNMIVM